MDIRTYTGQSGMITLSYAEIALQKQNRSDTNEPGEAGY